MSIRNIMTGVFCGLTICAFAAETAPLAIPRVTQAPKMDGRLTDECWKNAAVLKDFTVVGKTETTDSTECRLVMDDTWLYFGFRCKNPGMSQMDQKVTERDAGVSPDDSVEVFFDPGSDGALFFQFMLSFANVQADRMHTQKGGCNTFWNLPWRSATKVEKDGWTAEMAIPLFLIASYGDPAKVRLNVFRNERRIILDPYGAKLKEEKESLCWSPVLKSYAEPDKFRPLTGFEGIKIGIPEMIALEEAEVGGYEMAGDKRAYTVKARLRSYTGKGGKALIEVRDCPLPDGKGEVVALEVTVKPMQSEEFIIHVPVTSLQRRETVVTLKEAGSGAALRKLTLKEAAVLNLMGEALTDRNYYTTEKEAHLRIRIGLPEAELKNKTLIVKLADGKVLVKAKEAVRDMEVAIPLKKVPLGEHALTVALEDAKDAVVVEGKTVLTKRAPRPGCEVKVDRFNRRLLKNGVPLFPFGLVKSDCSEAGLKQVAAAEHTGILRWDYSLMKTAELTNMTAAAQALGLDVVDCTWEHVWRCVNAEGSVFDTSPRDAAHAKELMESLERGLAKARQPTADNIRAIRDYPNLIGYFNVDEPGSGNVEAKMAASRALYKWIHQEDGYRPVFSVFNRMIPEGGLDVSDVVMYDVYNYPGWKKAWGPLYGRPSYMGDQMLKLKKRADSVNKPAMMVPMAEGLDVRRCWRLMLPGEQRSQTYLAVIHGAKGLFYFEDSSLYTQNMWDTLADLARQMKVLGPAAVSDEVYPAVRYAPVDLNADKEVYPDVQATLFKNPSGGYILMAANAVYHPVDVKFSVPGLNTQAGVKPLFTGKKITAAGEGFQDTFEPLGTRAYALELRPDAAKPVALALELSAHPERAMALKWFDSADEFKNRRNCVANPSFEVCTVPGLPDHVRPMQIPYPLIGAPDPNAIFALDAVNPWHGKYSIRIKLAGYGMYGVCYPPKLEQPTPYVFSMYLRGAKDGDMAYVAVTSDGGIVWPEAAYIPGCGGGKKMKAFSLTTEWKRYWVSGLVPKGAEGGVGFGIGPVGPSDGAPNKDPIIWIDGLQMESGTEPTAFTTE